MHFKDVSSIKFIFLIKFPFFLWKVEQKWKWLAPGVRSSSVSKEGKSPRGDSKGSVQSMQMTGRWETFEIGEWRCDRSLVISRSKLTRGLQPEKFMCRKTRLAIDRSSRPTDQQNIAIFECLVSDCWSESKMWISKHKWLLWRKTPSSSKIGTTPSIKFGRLSVNWKGVRAKFSIFRLSWSMKWN